MAQKKTSHAATRNGDAGAAGNSLIICRNKHWRYISSFHGPWLQLPPEILESLAHQNYTMPHPRLIDPALFFDIVKIRRAVEEATEDAVRAATGLSSAQSGNSMGRLDPFGLGSGAGPKMSKERIHRVRQKAVKALSKAYALDEVAASVATMQSTSSLEDVAHHVLKRDVTDNDARYVHFYHEKIPSRMMEQYTPLQPLTEIIQSLPLEHQAPPLRTRGLVQIFKGQYEGAAHDFTLALQIAQELKLRHKPGADQLVLSRQFKEERDKWNNSGRDWRSVPQLKEEEQPSSLEQQLLFNRGGVYLTLACQYVPVALNASGASGGKKPNSNGTFGHAGGQQNGTAEQFTQTQLDARKRVKTYARRALKDYMAFLSTFDYTPGLPFEITSEIMRRVYDLANGQKSQARSSRDRMLENGSSPSNGNSSALVKHKKKDRMGTVPELDADGWPKLPMPQIHPASALFAERPPPGLPEFPDSKAGQEQEPADPLSLGSREAITYHPLLTDALHSLLLSHALLQTSPTELLRHAYSAARLARIADGYPIFQAARSPARADWIEVIRRANNWIGLSQPWQKLCHPAPLPTAAAPEFQRDSSSALASKYGNPQKTADIVSDKPVETSEQRRERIKQQAILDSLGDERVVDEETFQRAVRAREARAAEDEATLGAENSTAADIVSVSSASESAASSPQPTRSTSSTASDLRTNVSTSSSASDSNGYANHPTPKRWAQDDSKEYPISTERADIIARWIKEAPLSVGAKKKRRPAKKKVRAGNDDVVDGASEGIGGMTLDGEQDGDEGLD